MERIKTENINKNIIKKRLPFNIGMEQKCIKNELQM